MIRHLVGRAADVGRQQHIGALADSKVGFRGRLGIQHINDGAGNGLLPQHLLQGGIVHNGGAGGIDEQRGLFHGAQQRLGDHAPGGVRHRQVQRHDVALAENLLKALFAVMALIAGQERVIEGNIALKPI